MQVQISVTYDTDNGFDRNRARFLFNHLTGDQPAPSVTIGDVVTQSAQGPAAVQPDAQTEANIKARRQEQAAAARAAKANKAQQDANKPTRVSGGVQSPPVDVSGTNGAGDQDQDDDLGLTNPGMSPGEAKDQALALMREAYAAGHVAEVKALQKKFNVAKFYDVPVDQGHSFYQQAMQLVQGVGLRQ